MGGWRGWIRAAASSASLPGAPYEQGTVDLPPESILVLYSDGVTDTVNEQDQMFGIQRLADFINTAGALPADQILRRLDQSIQQFPARPRSPSMT